MRRSIIPIFRKLYRSNKLLVFLSVTFIILVFTGSLNGVFERLGLMRRRRPHHHHHQSLLRGFQNLMNGDTWQKAEAGLINGAEYIQDESNGQGEDGDVTTEGLDEDAKQQAAKAENDKAEHLRKWEEGLAELSDMARHNADALHGD